MGLADRAGHFPAASGGEQQRVAWPGLWQKPELLLCDEPTGALDLKTGIQILKLLRDFNIKYKKTVMVITHNASIADMADRVFSLKDGELASVRVIDNPKSPEEVSW